MLTVTNGLVQLQTSAETCSWCPVLRELAEQKVIFIDMTSGALRELLQLYRNLNNYELDPLYAEEVEERLERGNTAHDLKIRTLNIGGTAVQLSKARLLSIPYFQAVKKFGKSHSMEFDRDSEAFLAYLQAKRNAKLTTPAARREAVFWLDDLPLPSAAAKLSPLGQALPLGQAPRQRQLTYITQSPQITYFRHVYRRHTAFQKQIHQRRCRGPEIEIVLGPEFGVLGKVLLRGLAVDQIEHASIEFHNIKRFDYDTEVLQIEAANIRTGGWDMVLFASLGTPWPLSRVPATIRLRLRTDQECVVAAVCGQVDSDEERRLLLNDTEMLCRSWTSHRAENLVLPEGGIVAIFVYSAEPVSGGVYYQADTLVSNLDEEITVRLPAGWHMISYSLGYIVPAGRVFTHFRQPSGHLESNGVDYELRLNRCCEIRLLEYGVLGIGLHMTPYSKTLTMHPPPPVPAAPNFLEAWPLHGNPNAQDDDNNSDDEDDGDLPVPL